MSVAAVAQAGAFLSREDSGVGVPSLSASSRAQDVTQSGLTAIDAHGAILQEYQGLSSQGKHIFDTRPIVSAIFLELQMKAQTLSELKKQVQEFHQQLGEYREKWKDLWSSVEAHVYSEAVRSKTVSAYDDRFVDTIEKLLEERRPLVAEHQKVCKEVPEKFLRFVEFLEWCEKLRGTRQSRTNLFFDKVAAEFEVDQVVVLEIDTAIGLMIKNLNDDKIAIESMWKEIDGLWWDVVELIRIGRCDVEGQLYGANSYLIGCERPGISEIKHFEQKTPNLLYERSAAASSSSVQ